MPLIFKSEIANQKAKLGIWELQEPVAVLLKMACLNKNDSENFPKLKHESRKKQWLASRVILGEISGNNKLAISYEKSGRPFINDGLHYISISHTAKYVSVIVAESVKVGIDIEHVHPRILKVAPKFISPQEDQFLKHHQNLQESLILVWSAKETLFKINAQANMDFKNNILIEPFEAKNKGVMHASIVKDGLTQKYTLNYQKINDHFLVYSLDTI